ncbi:Cof-type HAD-IIB family hydrolase [Streptococcus halotolerans]|uniref:Cof-type HAD-IIB family hydrolase n=1 Tax=Streptococcus halotolerans TaxID=1814128 RepID=UPI000786BC7B|nr:Cof-type HAD-IIB family hydrolase [Streptococcus halotolerans]
MLSENLSLNPNIKLVAIDMDGTLLDEAKQLTAENKEAIRKARQAGVHVVICTGRPKSGILPYAQELGLEDDYVIANNGSWLFKTNDWSPLASHSLSREALEHIVAIFDNTPGINLVFFTQEANYALGKELYPAAIRDAEIENSKLYHTTFEAFLDLDIPVAVAVFMGEETVMDAFQDRADALLSEQVATVRSMDYAYEALPLGVDKGRALKDLAAELNLAPESIMVLGDGNNDLEMFDFAGVAVAMANASDAVKAQADFVTHSNQESGVAKAIYDHIL